MGTIIKLDSVQDYNELLGIETVHPLLDRLADPFFHIQFTHNFSF